MNGGKIGTLGQIAGYDVIMLADTITVMRGDKAIVDRHEVPNYGTAFADLCNRKRFAIGWASFGDGEMECLYFYDKADGNFGYALNITDTWLSEWGYAPFE